RSAAVQGLAQLVREGKPSDEQRRQVMQVITDALGSDSRNIRFGALATLREMGPAAKDALPAVEKISQDAPEERVRELARQTAEQTRGKPAAAPASELTQLREEVERLRRKQEALRERLNKYEKAEKKP